MNHTKELQWSLWVNIYTHITHLYIYIYTNRLRHNRHTNPQPVLTKPSNTPSARRCRFDKPFNLKPPGFDLAWLWLGAQDCSTRVLFHSIVELFVGFSFVVLNLNFNISRSVVTVTAGCVWSLF